MGKVKIAIIGVGARGRHTHGRNIFNSSMADVVAIVEPRDDRRQAAKEDFHLPGEACYRTLDEFIKAPKLADAAIIATQDRFHHEHAVAALRAGYDILLEKPIATTLEDCEDIANTAKSLGRKAAVCHELRYAPFYKAARRAISDGIIGEPVNITAMECVCYWHQAHSFVRGNWGNSADSVFMLLAKCCHDLDLIAWLMGKPAERVSSFGSLTHFKEENAPKGSASRCTENCAAKEACPYNSERFYVEGLRHNKGWPINVLTEDLTEEGIREALRSGPYGRCVYRCDNDVVDHQVVNMRFAGGGTASLTMSGLTHRGDRELNIMGTKGEIYGSLGENKLTVAPFGQEPRVLDLNKEILGSADHGGGDELLMDDFIRYIAGEPYDSVSMTGMDVSLQSHRIAFAAEQSRLTGQTVEV